MIDRDRAEALFFESNGLHAAGNAAGAEASLREAIAILPNFAEAYANLALLLSLRGALDEAEVNYRRALDLDPLQFRTWLNFGAHLAQRKRFAEAEGAYREALRLDPAYPGAWSNLGVLYACMQREAEAEQCHRHALTLAPDHANARFNLAYLLLRQGRYEEGWQCMEARDWYAVIAERIHCPRWRGEPVAGKSVLIAFEAGHGDMIQFCRYAAILKAQGATVVHVICHPGLKSLFATLKGIDAAFSFGDPVDTTGYDFWTPPLSLPFHCHTRLDSIPADLPYLSAPPDKAAQWASRLPAEGLRIGLVWKGSRGFENDADRSLPSLETLAPLWEVPGVRFISLQKGAGEDELACWSLPITNLGSEVGDFADTAAVISGLDLVISVDTGVAHLTGALAKPCWVLLPWYKADWRWLANREDSPWYPGVMRLFRQAAIGEWAPVIATVREALAALASAKPAA